MKKPYHFLPAIAVFMSSLSFVSCKKQVAESETIPTPASVPVPPPSTSCKPNVLAYSGGGQWVTLTQKWYSADGKVKNLKATSPNSAVIFISQYLEMIFQTDWAEVTYQGNQVNLTDVQNSNNLHMRVTLDDLGRPVATYYYNHPHPEGSPQFWNDTSYYYYNGDRLDYVLSFYTTNGYGGPTPMSFYRRFDFSYDSHGDVTQAGDFYFQYDYTKPVQGIILDYEISSPLTLLEDMDLIKLPMHYAVTKFGFGPSASSEFKDYVITDGLVRSYSTTDGFGTPYTIYNGWDCGTSGPATTIANQQQFQKQYSESSH